MDETGWRWSHALDAYGLITARPGAARVRHERRREPDLPCRGAGATARSATSQPFAERGGESVACDSEGNVYVANGQIFVYGASGEPIGRIDVPERPTGCCSAARMAARCTCSRTDRCTQSGCVDSGSHTACGRSQRESGDRLGTRRWRP